MKELGILNRLHWRFIFQKIWLILYIQNCMKRIVPILFLIVSLNPLRAQQGGESVYKFLEISAAPRVASLGADFLPVNDDDIFLAFHNPSLVNEKMHNHLGLSFLDYYADIKAGNVVYSRTLEEFGSFIGGVQFMHYGTFTRTDATGFEQGTFSASDVALSVGWGRVLHPGFSIGADVKFIFSSYDAYSSIGISTDVTGSYTSESGNFVSSLLFRNMGRQLKAYTDGDKEKLPFKIVGGASYKLEHAPFRFFFLLNNLQRWNLTYNDPLISGNEIDPLTGEPVAKRKGADFANNLFRHIVVGTEMSLGSLLKIRLGYNYRVQQELGLQSNAGLAGFSWGLGVKLGHYFIDFSRSRFHVAGAPNYFSIRTDLSNIAIKSKKKNKVADFR